MQCEDGKFQAGDQIVLTNLAKDVGKNGQEGVVLAALHSAEFLIRMHETQKTVRAQVRNIAHAERKVPFQFRFY